MSEKNKEKLDPERQGALDGLDSSRRMASFERAKRYVDDIRLSKESISSKPSFFNLSPSPTFNRDESIDEFRSQHEIRPAPSPSPSLPAIDPNNNKDGQGPSTSRADSLPGLRRSNFSKSASGSRLMFKSTPRHVCDCLAQNCGEKEHSNRRQFIEHYYNSRTRLPTANAMSSFNISTPLSSLNECDAITKRLLSSPIRTNNLDERANKRPQASDLDKSRRASLGAGTMTDQVFSFSSNQYDSLEANYRDSPIDPKPDQDNQTNCDSLLESSNSTGENGVKLKQQQGRSLSVCHDETLKPRHRKTNPNHSSNLSRAVSLACESGASKRLLTIIPLFGCDIHELEQFMKLGLILPPPIDSAVDYILANGSEAVGIFRKSGVKSRILALRQRIEENQYVKMEEMNKQNEFSIYDIADLVKMWFRELRPAPLMTKELIELISNYLKTTTDSRTPKSIGRSGSSQNNEMEIEGKINAIVSAGGDLKQMINKLITPTHRALFSKALSFLTSIAHKSEFNQMTSQNLAICLTPSLCATESDQVSIMIAQKALEYCIDNYRILF